MRREKRPGEGRAGNEGNEMGWCNYCQQGGGTIKVGEINVVCERAAPSLLVSPCSTSLGRGKEGRGCQYPRHGLAIPGDSQVERHGPFPLTFTIFYLPNFLKFFIRRGLLSRLLFSICRLLVVLFSVFFKGPQVLPYSLELLYFCL